MNPSRPRRVAAICAVLLGSLTIVAPASAETQCVHVAAAANLVRVLEPLATAFAVTAPDIELRLSTAATGSLVAQIRHGAPFEVLLSADPDYPAALVESGDAVAESLRPFATGQLVLWPAPPGGLDGLRDSPRRRIALAHPDIAPFGRAARRVLRDAGLWDALAPRLILGENVAQALHFVQSGNADHGFVAASLLSPAEHKQGLALPCPDRALQHTAVLLRRGQASAAARRFLEWLGQPEAQALLTAHGYGPANPGIDAPR